MVIFIKNVSFLRFMGDDIIPQIRTLDDAIQLISKELDPNLAEKRFEFYLGACVGILKYREEHEPVHCNHSISGCDFYKDGKYYGSLVVDIDPDWKMLNSADYQGQHPNINTVAHPHIGVNIVRQRTTTNPNVLLGRTDAHQTAFLGVSPKAEAVNSGLSAVFLRKYID